MLTTYPEGRRGLQLLPVLVLTCMLAGCVSTKSLRAAGGTPVREYPRVVLMPPDVLVVEITTAGVPIPRADWTASAEKTLVDVTEDAVLARLGTLLPYRPPAAETGMPVDRRHLPALRLYQVVLGSILAYNYQPSSGGRGRGPSLVTKDRKALDWTLGHTITPLRADYQADYLLFLTYRQASSNAGRAAVSAAALALFGMIAPTSQTIGLASLVDLHTGEVVWTNMLKGSEIEVGEPEGLREKMRELFKGWPL